MYVVLIARITRDDAVHLVWRIFGLDRRSAYKAHVLATIQIGDNFSGDLEGVRIIIREMIRHAGDTRMHVAAAELFRIDDLSYNFV